MPHIPDHELLMDADGELPAERAASLREHLAGCAACRERQTAIVGTLTMAVDAHLEQELPPIDGARALLHARLHTAPARPWAALAAASAAAVLLALSLLPEGRPPDRPSGSLTPGAVLHTSAVTLCAPGGEGARPPIDPALARQVFRSYGIHDPQPRAYEVDYLIPPDLGGSGDVRNLWPQPYNAGAWNARVKDALEDRLQAMVCRGEINLTTAQRDIAGDWVAAYRKYFGTHEPLPDHMAFRRDEPWE